MGRRKVKGKRKEAILAHIHAARFVFDAYAFQKSGEQNANTKSRMGKSPTITSRQLLIQEFLHFFSGEETASYCIVLYCIELVVYFASSCHRTVCDTTAITTCRYNVSKPSLRYQTHIVYASFFFFFVVTLLNPSPSSSAQVDGIKGPTFPFPRVHLSIWSCELGHHSLTAPTLVKQPFFCVCARTCLQDLLLFGSGRPVEDVLNEAPPVRNATET